MLGLGSNVTSGYISKFETLTDTSGLSLWLKNNVGITESTGTVVSWDDSSGNGNDAVQANISNRGVKEGGGVDFEESEADHYDLDSAIVIAENQGFCLAIVLDQETDTNNTILSKETNDVIQISAHDITIMTNDDTSTTTTAAFVTNTFAAGSKMLVMINRSDGADNKFSFYKNGTQISTISAGSTNELQGENPYGFDINVVGIRPNVPQSFDGIIYELAFWNKGLSESEIADVNSYLTSTHGL